MRIEEEIRQRLDAVNIAIRAAYGTAATMSFANTRRAILTERARELETKRAILHWVLGKDEE